MQTQRLGWAGATDKCLRDCALQAKCLNADVLLPDMQIAWRNKSILWHNGSIGNRESCGNISGRIMEDPNQSMGDVIVIRARQLRFLWMTALMVVILPNIYAQGNQPTCFKYPNGCIACSDGCDEDLISCTGWACPDGTSGNNCGSCILSASQRTDPVLSLRLRGIKGLMDASIHTPSEMQMFRAVFLLGHGRSSRIAEFEAVEYIKYALLLN